MTRLWVAAALLTAVCLGSSKSTAGDAEDVKTLQQAGVEADGRALLRYLRARILAPDERSQIEQQIRQLGDESFAVRERATAALASRGIVAVNLLRRATMDPDAEIARRAERCLLQIEKVPSAAVASAVVRQLAKLNPEGAAEVLLAFLPNADDALTSDEIRAALTKVVMRGEAADAAAIRALEDASPLVRSAAGEALVRAGYRKARALINDADAVVRLRVALAMATRDHDKTAISTLIELLGVLPPGEAWLAEDVLHRLAGESAPSVGLGNDPASRNRCRDAWKAWWQRAAADADLSKLDGAPSLKGVTLVVQADVKQASGRVFEVNANGEVLWKIEDLQLPCDAVMVGADRVLIAEYTLQQVSLRELNGTTAWTVRCTMPQSLQALPDGHFLIATRDKVTEYDERQKEVFVFERTSADVVAAAKDRNGEYLVLTRSPGSGTCLRIDGQKKELRRFSTDPPGNFGGLHVLPNGHILVAHLNGLSEYNADGRRQPWMVKSPGQFSSVQRLPNGNTIATSMAEGRVIEFNREAKPVGEVRPIDGGTPRRAYRR